MRTAPAPLADFAGTLLLVGAGKMGGAMLEGWLALGMAAKNVVVLEPQPAGEIAALTRARPASQSVRPATSAKSSALVLAIKPQTAPDVMPTLKPYVGTIDRRRSRSWRAAPCGFSNRHCRPPR